MVYAVADKREELADILNCEDLPLLAKVWEAIGYFNNLDTDGKYHLAFSGGKDSHALLIVFLLWRRLYNKNTDNFEVLFADTRLETDSLYQVIDKIENYLSGIITFHRLDPEYSYWYYQFVKGYPVPDWRNRWCTNYLKVSPQNKKKKQGSQALTGRHLGESSTRDNRLNSSCNSSECGIDKIKDSHDPIINFRNCDVWDLIFYADGTILYDGVFNLMKSTYSQSTDEKGSLRMGCIMCPVVSINTLRNDNTRGDAIEFREVLEELRTCRRINSKRTKNFGAIYIEDRRRIWQKLDKQKLLNLGYINQAEIIEIEEKLKDDFCYPETYAHDWVASEHQRILSLPYEDSVFKPKKNKNIKSQEIIIKPEDAILETKQPVIVKQEFKPVVKAKTIITPSAKPFIKWAGGKMQLISKLTENLPGNFTKYCEPFVGGGALMFHLLNTQDHIEEVLINDSNPDLMLTYRVIQQDVAKLIKILTKVQEDYYKKTEDERRKYFEAVREKFNSDAKTFDYSTYSNSHVTRAAIVIFLNKTCFNGLWRVRKSDGGFNTSFGKYDNPLICDKHNLELVSKQLQRVFIRSGDFRDCSSFIDSNTLVYLDPPYIPASETANFTGYSKASWCLFDNLKLSEFIESQHAKQAKILLSSSNTSFWNDLDFMQKVEVSAKRNVACKVESRDGCKELILRNY